MTNKERKDYAIEVVGKLRLLVLKGSTDQRSLNFNAILAKWKPMYHQYWIKCLLEMGILETDDPRCILPRHVSKVVGGIWNQGDYTDEEIYKAIVDYATNARHRNEFKRVEKFKQAVDTEELDTVDEERDEEPIAIPSTSDVDALTTVKDTMISIDEAWEAVESLREENEKLTALIKELVESPKKVNKVSFRLFGITIWERIYN